MLGPTLTRKKALMGLLTTLLDLMDHTDGEALPVPRAVLAELVTLLGTSPQRRCLVCDRHILGTTRRRYCNDACRCKAMRVRHGWIPIRQRQTPTPDLWDEMATALTMTLR